MAGESHSQISTVLGITANLLRLLSFLTRTVAVSPKDLLDDCAPLKSVNGH